MTIEQKSDGGPIIRWSVSPQARRAAAEALGPEHRFVVRLVSMDGHARVRDVEADPEGGETALAPPDALDSFRVMVGFRGPLKAFYPVARSAPFSPKR